MNILQKIQIHILANILYLNVTEGNKKTFEKKMLWIIAETLACLLDVSNTYALIFHIEETIKKHK